MIARNKGIRNLMKLKLTIIFAVSFLGITACFKTPEYPIEPVIKFVSYSTVQPYIIPDTGNIRISFTDGDGDLGKLRNNDSGSLSRIFIRDVKYSLDKTPQVLPIIPQKGTTKAISGTIDIKLAGSSGIGLFDESSCLLYQHPYDTLIFEIYIKDRAGNKSNVITTPPLVVSCP
jgi:hypothetical protein